jgi:Skp family chaperone for outer membrane proteins
MEAMKKQAEMRMAEQQHQQQLEHSQQTQDLQAKQQLLQMLLNTKNQPKGE